MINESRTIKVLAALVASMTAGILLLIALSDSPLSAGAFSLASYSSLDPIEQIIQSSAEVNSGRWNRIEIYYSNTKGGNLKQIAILNGHTSPTDTNFHFLVCNGLGDVDGLIQATEKWKKQWSCVPGRNWYGNGQTIRLCIVGVAKGKMSTDCQIRRTAALVDTLRRKFNIHQNETSYPENWHF